MTQSRCRFVQIKLKKLLLQKFKKYVCSLFVDDKLLRVYIGIGWTLYPAVIMAKILKPFSISMYNINYMVYNTWISLTLSHLRYLYPARGLLRPGAG